MRLPKLLLIDDDYEIYNLVDKILGFLIDLTYAQNGVEGLSFLENQEFDLIIVDLNLGDKFGMDLIKQSKEKFPDKTLNFIILTGKESIENEVEGHRLGVNEYIKKPIVPEIFRAIVEKNLRQTITKDDQTLKSGIISVDLPSLTVTLNEQVPEEITLTSKEFQILVRLMKNEGRVLSREQIFESIWNHESNSMQRTIDMHISSLRKKLKNAGSYINTIRSVGYKFESRPI